MSEVLAKRKILFVQTQAENAGAQEISRLLGEKLGQRGYEVHHLFFFRRTAGYDAQANTSFCALERPTNPLQVARLLLRLYQEYRRIKPDVTITLQHYGNVIGGLVARLAGLKHIVVNTTSAPEMMNAPTRFADKMLGTYGVYDKIIVNSKDTEDEYATWPQAYRALMQRIDHGFEDKSVAISKVDARTQLGLPQDVTLLGCVSRLHPLKNPLVNVQLLAKQPGWHLAHAGQGPEREPMLALAKELGCAERLHLVGELGPREIGVFLAGLDVFVFPSTSETFGLAPVEAAQAGVPVVVNGLPVLREVLQSAEGAAALFVEASDTAAYEAAVSSVLKDTALRQRLTASGQRLKERYSLETMVDAYQAVIEDQLATKAQL